VPDGTVYSVFAVPAEGLICPNTLYVIAIFYLLFLIFIKSGQVQVLYSDLQKFVASLLMHQFVLD
jgi:hypothetical protein